MSLTERLNRWCGTFPVPFALYAQTLTEGHTNDEIAHELDLVCDEVKPEPKNWIGLACDEKLPDSDWLAPGYLAGWPEKPESTRRDIPVALILYRVSGAETTRIIASVTKKFEDELALAKTAALNHSALWRAERERLRIESLFRHSPDYHSIRYKDKEYGLTDVQAATVKRLHEAYLNGTPELSQAYILTELESEMGERGERLRDCFKGRNSGLWGKSALIIPGTTKGTVRLNLLPMPRVRK